MILILPGRCVLFSLGCVLFSLGGVSYSPCGGCVLFSLGVCLGVPEATKQAEAACSDPPLSRRACGEADLHDGGTQENPQHHHHPRDGFPRWGNGEE